MPDVDLVDGSEVMCVVCGVVIPLQLNMCMCVLLLLLCCRRQVERAGTDSAVSAF